MPGALKKAALKRPPVAAESASEDESMSDSAPPSRAVRFGATVVKSVGKAESRAPAVESASEGSDDDEDSDEASAEEDDDEGSDDSEDGDDDDDDENDDEGDDDDDNDTDDEVAQGLGASAEHLDALRKQVSRLDKDDSEALVTVVKARASEKQKAQHVATQLRLYQSFLQVRLRLQNPVVTAERLPPPALWPRFEAADAKVGEARAQAAAAVAGVLTDLIQLERELATAAPAISASAAGEVPFAVPTAWAGLGGKRRRAEADAGAGAGAAAGAQQEDASAGAAGHSAKRRAEGSATGGRDSEEDKEADLAALERYLSASWAAGEAQRSSVMDRWARRVQVATGRADLAAGAGGGRGGGGPGAGGGLKTLGKSLSEQVAHILDVESDRYVQRSRIRRLSTRSLGVPEPVAAPAAGEEDERERIAREARERLDPEVFDDNDFFVSLVREVTLTDAAGNAAGSAKGGAFLASRTQEALDSLRRARNTQSSAERRASKGRRLRFTPIPKLQNFMVPVLDSNWRAALSSGGESAQEALTDELLLGLFGQSRSAAASAAVLEAKAKARADERAGLTRAGAGSAAQSDARKVRGLGFGGDGEADDDVDDDDAHGAGDVASAADAYSTKVDTEGDFEMVASDDDDAGGDVAGDVVDEEEEEEEEERRYVPEPAKGKGKGAAIAAPGMAKAKAKAKATAKGKGKRAAGGDGDDDDGEAHSAWFK